MEKVIKTVYTTFYQKTTGVSYREQFVVALTTVAFMLAIVVPLIALLLFN